MQAYLRLVQRRKSPFTCMTPRNRGRDEANFKEKGGPEIGLALCKPPSFNLAKHSSSMVMVPASLLDQISEVLKRNGAKFDGFVKSPFCPIFVIPAKAGIQLIQAVLDSCFRRSDGFSDFLRDHQI
jgi:hypothetical protein